VHENIQYSTALEEWQDDEPMVSKCVLIGRRLDHDALRERWQKCISPAEGSSVGTSIGLGGVQAAAARLAQGFGY